MYTLTFNESTMLDLWDHRNGTYGRQFFGAVVIPYSGLFTNKANSFYTEVPKLLCPYQINDIIIIQQQWAKTESRGYIYKIDQDYALDPLVGDFNYLPAYSMPDEAAQMYGRIVSATPWLVSSDIANKFIPAGMNIDNWAGTAKVIGNVDTGTKILNKIRKRRNAEVLGKSYQPTVRTSDPPTIKYVPYQMTKPNKPMLHFSVEGASYDVVLPSRNYTDAAQAYYTLWGLGPSYDPQALKSGYPVDSDYSFEYDSYVLSSWATYPKSLTVAEAESLMNSGVHLYQRGLAADSPTNDRNSASAKFIYILLDDQKFAIPIYAYYPTETIDASQPVFAWLISGYLCEKDGTIIGNVF